MAETTPDPHIANGLRLLAAAYLEKAAKEGDQEQQPGEVKQSDNSPD